MPEPFRLTTGDPAFDPRKPIMVNGYHFVPVVGVTRDGRPLKLSAGRVRERG